MEGRLAGAYVAAKAAALDDRLEELLYADAGSGGAAPLPGGVRDAALELANCLVRCPCKVSGKNPQVALELASCLVRCLPAWASAPWT